MRDLIITIIAAIVMITVISALIALPVMILWNAVVPGIFGLTKINFAQAICLSLLCNFLFGGSRSTKKE